MYGDPPLQRIEGAIFVPFRNGGSWGLYDECRRPIMEAVDRRGNDRIPHHPVDWNVQESIEKDVSGQTYLYCGLLNPHYGHFLINSLPKFWPYASGKTTPKVKILTADRPENIRSFAIDILSQIGIGFNDFCWFDRPTQIEAVIIPSPSILEQYWAYTVFKDLCEKIGSRWWPEIDTQITPAYLSKSKLKGGVGRFANENVVEEIMRSAGIDIFYPETMSVSDQVRLFTERMICIGPTGSAFHTTIFAPKRRRVICFNPADRYNSNFDLIDNLNINSSSYFYQPEMDYESNSDGFLTTVWLKDPERLALDLLEIVQQETPWRKRS